MKEIQLMNKIPFLISIRCGRPNDRTVSHIIKSKKTYLHEYIILLQRMQCLRKMPSIGRFSLFSSLQHIH